MKKLYFLLIAISTLSVQCFAHVNLLTPSGSVTYNVGETVTLEWQIAISHNIQNWDLYFSEDNGSNWDPIQLDIPSTGNAVGLIVTYDWVAPDVPTSEAKIWIYMDNAATDYEDISAAFTIVSPIGIQENLNLDYIDLYPNPVRAGDDIYLSIEGSELDNFTFQIFDITGNQINFNISDKSAGVKEFSLALNGIKTGLYFLVLIEQNAIVNRKPFLIIEQ